MLPPAQIEEATQAATKLATGVNWTLATFAIFVWLMTLLIAFLLIRSMTRKRDDEVSALVKERNDAETGWRKDLQGQVVKRGEDAQRVESGLMDSASATRDQSVRIDALAMRIRDLEKVCEKVDRRVEAMLAILDRRNQPRDAGG